MNSTLLLIFIIVNALALGAALAVGARHAYAHFKPDKHDEAPHPKVQGLQLPPTVKHKILEAAEGKYEHILEQSAVQLQKDMQTTAHLLNQKLEKLGESIVAKELERYQASLESIRLETTEHLQAAQSDIQGHQDELKKSLEAKKAELEAQLVRDMEEEKARLQQQIDQKLGDAVASFLLDTLGHNVDLGAQTAYITKMLDEHKDEFKHEVGHEVSSAK